MIVIVNNRRYQTYNQFELDYVETDCYNFEISYTADVGYFFARKYHLLLPQFLILLPLKK